VRSTPAPLTTITRSSRNFCGTRIGMSNILWATIFLIAGILFLSNVNRIAQFNQTCGVKLKSLFHKKLGNSPLNRELWSIGTAIDLENSTIAIVRVKGSRSGVQSLDRHRGEPILDEVLALRSWLRERVEDGSRMLFPSQKGGAMSRMQFLRLFRKYALAVGVPPDLHTLTSCGTRSALRWPRNMLMCTRFSSGRATRTFPTQ
jgi:hypothetical protein